MDEFVVTADDPRAADVQALLDTHLTFARGQTPPEDAHALDIDELLADHVLFYSIRDHGVLLGVGALQQLDAHHAEIKSMHTAEVARGRGVARAMLDHLVGTAKARGCHRVSLETGSMAAFAPSRALYTSAGFRECAPFAGYLPSPNSVFMTLKLGR